MKSLSRRSTVPVLLLAAGAVLAGCSSAPAKPVSVDEIWAQAPAAVTSGEPALQVCVLPARRYFRLSDAPGGKTVIAVPHTRADQAAGQPSYAGPLSYPVTFGVRSPWLFSLADGFLRVELDGAGKRHLTASVVGAKEAVPPPLVNENELWIWCGREPSEENYDPRGTFVGIRLSRAP